MRKNPFYTLMFIFLLFIPGCRQGGNPASGPGKKSGTAITAPTDDFYQEIGQQAGLDFAHSILFSLTAEARLSSTLIRMAGLIYLPAAGPGLRELARAKNHQ
jgi:hypothetical protein